MDDKDYDIFMDTIRRMIDDGIDKKIKQEGFFKAYTGTVISATLPSQTDFFQQKCSVDIVFTIIDNLLNKSGQKLQLGDTVTVMEKYGSNYSNCYISVKNG
jgi:hypothetical protein